MLGNTVGSKIWCLEEGMKKNEWMPVGMYT